MYSIARERAYRPARKELTTFAVLTIILIVVTIINACLCTHNFKKGLKPYIYTSKTAESDEKMGYGEAQATELSGGFVKSPSSGGPMGPRMEID